MSDKPIIETPYGPVTEWARRAAAENLKDADKYAEAMSFLTQRLGSVEAAEAELRRVYPEAFS